MQRCLSLRGLTSHPVAIRKSCFFTGSLHFYEFAVFSSHKIEINAHKLVLFVIKIQYSLPIQNTGTHCGEQFLHWRGVEFFFSHKFPAGNGEGQTGSGNCRGACSSVGLQNIAIDPDRSRPELLEIDNCSQRATDQALDLHAAAVEATFCGVARLSRLRRIWKHRILSRKPAARHYLLFYPARQHFINSDAADHACLPYRNKY